VLPPADPTDPETRVLLVCVAQYPQASSPSGAVQFLGCDSSNCDPDADQIFGRSYIWRADPDQRGELEALDLPVGYPEPGESGFGAQDFFCGAHTFLPDGRVIWVGGSDYVRTCDTQGGACPQPFYGHNGVWFLNTSTDTPTWEDIADPPVVLSKNRWYPNAVELANGDVFVFGHTQKPSMGTPFADKEQQEHRDEFDYSAGVVTTTSTNSRPNIPYPAGCSGTTLTIVEDYAKMHLLSNGLLMQSIRAVDDGLGQHAVISGPSRFLDVRRQSWSCEFSQGEAYHDAHSETWRWRDNGSDGTTTDLRIGGNSVHLIAWNGTVGDPPVDEDFTEVVYLVGGSNKNVSFDLCTGVVDSQLPFAVVRMIDPDINTAWSDKTTSTLDDPPVLSGRRALSNTVILLDGSLLAVGGVVPYNNACTANLYPDRLLTEEIFGDTSDEQWAVLAPQVHRRSYHGIACLLPDGAVLSAGGYESGDLSLNAEHTIEVFNPPYMFADSRPLITIGTLDASDPKGYQEIVEFQVLMPIGDAPLRVALIRPGSVTHTTDTGQRYVELAIESQTQVSGRLWELEVNMPLTPYYAPPGYYMLTVVDDDQVPSIAAWIQLGS